MSRILNLTTAARAWMVNQREILLEDQFHDYTKADVDAHATHCKVIEAEIQLAEEATSLPAPMALSRMNEHINDLRLGDRIHGIQQIDAGGHAAIADVVVRFDDADSDYEPGLLLAQRIVAIPAMIAALQAIAERAKDGDAVLVTLARRALTKAGVV